MQQLYYILCYLMKYLYTLQAGQFEFVLLKIGEKQPITICVQWHSASWLSHELSQSVILIILQLKQENHFFGSRLMCSLYSQNTQRGPLLGICKWDTLHVHLPSKTTEHMGNTWVHLLPTYQVHHFSLDIFDFVVANQNILNAMHINNMKTHE